MSAQNGNGDEQREITSSRLIRISKRTRGETMNNGARFTAYLSNQELDMLREQAHQTRTTVNWQVRTAIREFLGLDKRSEPLLPVTSDTDSES